MNKNDFTGRVVSIILKNKVTFQGILLNITDSWCYLKYIPVDYIIDGYIAISCRYIVEINVTEDDTFTQKILKLKGTNFENKIQLDISENVNMFTDLQKQSLLIKLELKDHYKSYIGKIELVRENSIKIRLFDTLGNWLDIETFLYKEVRAIYFDDDYINSLKLILSDFE